MNSIEEVVGTFPDGTSALMLACTWLRYVVTPVEQQEYIIGDGFEGCLYRRLTSFSRRLQTFLRIILDGAWKMQIYQWFPDSQQEVSILNKGSHGLIFLGRGALSRYNNACR